MKPKNILIAGVHKAGSTSLFNYFVEHPDICGSRVKEVHYYTGYRYDQSYQSQNSYESYFTHCSRNQIKLDASPSYMYGMSKVGQRIQSTLDKPKIIFILRNPVERFISYYKHCEGKFYIRKNESIEKFFEINMSNFGDDIDSPYHRGLFEGCYSMFLPYWFQEFEGDCKIVFLDELKNNPKQVMRDLCEWLNIDKSPYDNFKFTIDNKQFRHRNRAFGLLAKEINQKLQFYLRKHKRTKFFLKKIYQSINSDKTIKVQSKIILELEKFYMDYNNELLNLLVKEGYSNIPVWLQRSKTN